MTTPTTIRKSSAFPAMRRLSRWQMVWILDYTNEVTKDIRVISSDKDSLRYHAEWSSNRRLESD